MNDFPQQFDKGDKKLVAISPKMREFFVKARLLTRSHIDVSSLNREDLMEFRILLQEEIDQIAAQLNKAKGNAAANGVYSDPEWYRAAETAKKIRGRYMQEIQLQLRKARKFDSEYNNDLTQEDWNGFYKVMKYLQNSARKI